MSANKRRRRPSPRTVTRTGSETTRAIPTKTDQEEKRRRQAEAQRERQRARRRAARVARLRTSAIVAAIAGVAALGLSSLLRSASAGSVSDAALAVGKAAGCGSIQTPEGSNPSQQHLAPGDTPSYASVPGTAGAHDGTPLPADPHVYKSPVPEPQAVHNLEHAYVEIYYRADGPDALPSDVVDALASLADSGSKVIIAPYPSLPEGTSLALVAWNKLWSCPASVTVQQVKTIASGFIDAYRGSANAPEPGAA